MNTLFRNFWYAVGFTVLLFMYNADPNSTTFSDLVRLVQNPVTMHNVMGLTLMLIGVEILLSGFSISGVSKAAGNSSASKKMPPATESGHS